MFRQVKAAAISMKPRKWDRAHNADRLESFFRKAARSKPDLIVAPEGVLEGYVAHEARADAGKAAAMFALSEPESGPYISRFRELAGELGLCLCFGFAERIGSVVYNTVVFIDHHGKISGKYHKHEESILVMKGNRPVWTHQRLQRKLRAFDTPLGRCGLVICADRWYARLARTLVLDGAQFLLVSAFGSKGKAQNRTLLARARENGVPVVQANVGMNLIISRGEIAAYTWGADRVTVATIDVPAQPGTEAARVYEHEYLRIRKKEQWKWLPQDTREFPPVGGPVGRQHPRTQGREIWHF